MPGPPDVDARTLALVREIVGTTDVERLDVVPAIAVHDEEQLRPIDAVRVGNRYFVPTREHPGEWWMGELDDHGTLRVWGVYGTSLEEAVRHR